MLYIVKSYLFRTALNLNFLDNQRHLDFARKSMFCPFALTVNINKLDIKSKLLLFDWLFAPISLCTLDFLGIYNYKEIDTILTKLMTLS